MDEAAIGATIQVVLETVISLAADRIGLFFGFNDELKSLKESATTIQAVLADAEAKQGQNEHVKLWLKRLEGVAFEADHVFDELNYEILRRQVKSRNQQPLNGKVCFFFSFSYTKFAFRWRMSSKIRDINTKLKKINQEAIEFELSFRYQIEATLRVPATTGATTSRQTDSVVVPNVVGRVNDESKIVEMLLSPSNKVVSVIPIFGMGGLGKTTLAKTVYNDPKIDGHFVKKIWVCVADKCGGVEIFKLILESLTGKKVELSGKDTIIQEIRREVKENKYFIVLDDVWSQDQFLWDDFFNTLKGLNATTGSWCLVTTRLEEVANTMSRHLKMNVDPYRLEKLPEDDCWSIVKEKVIAGEEVPKELEAIKKQILKRCGGLPLAATLIGSWLLMNRKEEWLSIVKKSLLDGDQNGVEQILKVSFDHLSPTSVKKCFAYCSIFPQDTELEKDQLVELWMAEGFLQPDPKNEKLMEDRGDEYFRILLQSSLLEEVKVRMKTCYKMHDLVHDFAKSALNQDRYLVLNSTESIAEDIIKKNSTLLRTLFLKSNISGDVLSKFEYLHVLKLSGKDVKVLPASIGELIHLRVFDISDSEIKILPESLGNLYNLQTVRIKDHILEKGLPKWMSCLISLRHLHYYGPANIQMPSKMGQLTHLQTLKFFNVGQDDGCGIEELGTLKDLKGSLKIRNLELVNGKEGADVAKLFDKPNLSTLNFVWSRGLRVSDRCDQNVLEGLQPHPNLQELVIEHFMGDQLPQWFMNLSTLTELVLRDCELRELAALGQLAFLKNLKLNGLELRELPALGQLPSLQSLHLGSMRHIKSIGLSFYGVIDNEKEDRGRSSSSCSSCGQAVMSRKYFPALEYLYLGYMENLVEWKDSDEVRSKTGAEEIDLFPMLETLSIVRCSQLTSAPSHFPSIQRLDISGLYQVSLLKRILSSITNVSSLQLIGGAHAQNLYLELDKSKMRLKNCDCLPSEILEHLCNLPSLRDLRLERLSNLDLRLTCGTSFESLKPADGENSEMPEDLSDLECRRIILGQKSLESLEQLSIYNCLGSTSVCVEMLEPWTSLRRLEVFKCPNMVSFPLDLRQTPSLEHLTLFRCSKQMSNNMPKGFAFLTSLKSLRIGPFFDDSSVHKFDWSGLISSSTLRSLVLFGSPRIDSLPDQLQFLTSLTSLELFEFGVEALPDWIGNLTSLQNLTLGCCEKLRYLPSTTAMRRLAKLTDLLVLRCPLLHERCNPQSGADSEWPKISHIPMLDIRY